MPAQKGSGLLLKLGDGGSPEAFTTVGGLRATSITINQQAVDITHKDSAGWRDLLGGAGIRSIAVTGSGVFMDSAAEAGLQANILSGSVANYRIVFEDATGFAGGFLVTQLDYAGDYNGERTYTLSLESSGPVASL